MPNDHKIYRHNPFQGPPKIIQIGIFGSKVKHLATLVLVDRRTKKLCVRKLLFVDAIFFFSSDAFVGNLRLLI
jgi:hypothetical protein